MASIVSPCRLESKLSSTKTKIHTFAGGRAWVPSTFRVRGASPMCVRVCVVCVVFPRHLGTQGTRSPKIRLEITRNPSHDYFLATTQVCGIFPFSTKVLAVCQPWEVTEQAHLENLKLFSTFNSVVVQFYLNTLIWMATRIMGERWRFLQEVFAFSVSVYMNGQSLRLVKFEKCFGLFNFTWVSHCFHEVDAFVGDWLFPAVVLLFVLPNIEAECTNRQYCRNEYNSTSRWFYRTHWNLSSVPRDIPTEALRVLLHDNAITYIPAGVFSHLSQCLSLYLQDNQISSVSEQAFTGLESLTYLSLRRNKISKYTLQHIMFYVLKSLTNIDLASNQITNIEQHTFRELETLQQLWLNYNKIVILQVSIFTGLYNLTNLYLQDNQISSIEKQAFSGLESLEDLSLFDNKISLIEVGIFSGLKSLTKLNLESNQVVYIEDQSFGDLVSLQILNLNRNRISTLQPGIFTGLNDLMELHLKDNNISRIQEGTLDSLHAIQMISLSNNKLTTISPEVFINLPRPVNLVLRETTADTNPWNCSSLCWLKHEELHGTATIRGLFRPRSGGWFISRRLRRQSLCQHLQCGYSGRWLFSDHVLLTWCALKSPAWHSLPWSLAFLQHPCGWKK